MKRLLLLMPLLLTACIYIGDDRADARIAKIRVLLAKESRLSDADKQVIQSTQPTVHLASGLAPRYFTWPLPSDRTAVIIDSSDPDKDDYSISLDFPPKK